MSSWVMTKTAAAVRERICSFLLTVVTLMLESSSRVASDKSGGCCAAVPSATAAIATARRDRGRMANFLIRLWREYKGALREQREGSGFSDGRFLHAEEFRSGSAWSGSHEGHEGHRKRLY